MAEFQSGQTEFDLFDEDVDTGEEAPENDDFDDDELAAIDASRAGSDVRPDSGGAS